MPKSECGSIPVLKAEVLTAAAALDLRIVEACLPGILANLELLSRHAAILAGEGRSAAA